jgi:ABC-type sugar transport system substrate-binding protein
MQVTLICIAAALATMGSSVSADAAGKKVAYFVTGPNNRYVAAVSKGFLERAKELGLEVTEFDNSYDPAVQVQQVDDAIARKFDLLAIMPASEKAIIPALARAKQAGIPVVTLVNDVAKGAEGLYVSFVGEDNYKLGQIAGESVVRAVKESGRDEAKVALVTGSLAEGNGLARVKGFNEAIKANPKIHVVATEDAFWDTAKSEQIAGQLFARFAPQGGLDVMYGMADNQAVAIERAAEAAGIPLGLEKGKLIVVSSNCDTDGLKAIREGKQYSTATQVPGNAGTHSAQIAADYLAGKKVPPVDHLVAELITKDNIDKWQEACTY